VVVPSVNGGTATDKARNMKFTLLLLILLTSLGLFEMIRHRLNRRRIPLRIHVNGSRGKSSVTRLIAAGLRAGGLRTLAKTTGSAACIIHPDGSESPVRRRGGPNIREQLKVIRTAAASGVDALVLECMAIRPDLQRVCEHGILKATLGVITNIRPDHLEVMGPTIEDVAANLASTVPHGAHLLTSEERFAPYLRQRAASCGSDFTLSTAEQVATAEMEGFSYVEFPENVSLALATCVAAGVSRDRALAGMRQAKPDVGALTRSWFAEGEKQVEFINAFAANDATSYRRIWEFLDLAENPDQIILLMNSRADRQRRSKDLAPLFGRELQACHYILIGGQTRSFGEMLFRQGVAADKVLNLGGQSPQQVWQRIVALARPRATVVGVGNIGGAGYDLLAFLGERESRK
jgi:poly-gamma-glutamate synthase PgsB/CapB